VESFRRPAVRDTTQPTLSFPPSGQLNMALDSMELIGISPAERSAIIARLMCLLMEAAGVDIEESGDDGR
jgi:hypothetical protein